MSRVKVYLVLGCVSIFYAVVTIIALTIGFALLGKRWLVRKAS